MSAVAPPKALRPFLVGESPREDGEWDMHCPLHDDGKRSAQINFDKGVWYCHAGCGGGSIDELLESKDSWVPMEDRKIQFTSPAPRSRGAAELPDDERIAAWSERLLADEIRLEELKAVRGLWTKTIAHFEIGFDPSSNAYTIPVRNLKRQIVNVRKYQITPTDGRRKIWGIEGHNAPRLFPAEVLKKSGDEIIICEGELDAVITNQYGFRAITRTGSAKTWKSSWSKLLSDRIVYVCHDADVAGQEANLKVAKSVAAFAREVRIVQLPYGVTDKHGKDLTDWWLENDGDVTAFRRLLEDSQLFDRAPASVEAVDPESTAVIDAFDSSRAGDPMALTVTIKGRSEPGYTIPRKTKYKCSMDNGKACEVCPLQERGGEAETVLQSSDPDVLEMMEATKTQVRDLLRRRAGIPKCPKVAIEVDQYQAVEVLFARPSVEHSTGGSNDYKGLKIVSVGRHNTAPNQTVQVIGALHADPRKQLNTFLAWDISTLETSIDRFELSENEVNRLKRFRPREGQQPLKRIRQIADDLSRHVTQIYGRPELHAAMDLTFHSALSFNFDGKLLSRGWLELLVVGDTRTGKSEAATRLAKFYKAGEVVSCESASIAGILGGLQQFGGNREWAVTWGAIPINDRRLVVLDEISGLEPEQIASLSSIRSSGIAELTKIQQERTHARTRLIWLGNPRGSSMSSYAYGVQAVGPLIGNPEDIARFDLAMSVASNDVPADEINRHSRKEKKRLVNQQDAAALLRWVWSRSADQIKFEPDAEEAVYEAALDLGKRYVEEPPLIQVANVREKVARFAVAIAGRLFSTDDAADSIIVKVEHVEAAVQFIDKVYNLPGFGYAERSKEIIADRNAARSEENIEQMKLILKSNLGMSRMLRSQGKFRRQDLEEALNIDREESNALISQMMELRMVYKVKGDVIVTAALNEILRKVK